MHCKYKISEIIDILIRETINQAPQSLRRSKRPLPEITEKNARIRIDSFLNSCVTYPENKFADRGIVICAGGLRMFRCAWVCIEMLRHLGCKLPIQVWQLRPSELTTTMRRLLEIAEVECVSASQYRRKYPVRILNAWELKPYAVLHSRFSEVLLLDADNVPVVDPTFLFSSVEYCKTGAVFWPDCDIHDPLNRIWRVLRLAYKADRQVESGQLIIDKQRSWESLNVTMFLNEHSDFFYRYVHGDKDTFYLAWRLLQASYAMTSYSPFQLKGAICQHDFEGNRIFQHRNFLKWDDPLRQIEGFQMEYLCREIITDLDNRLHSAAYPT